MRVKPSRTFTTNRLRPALSVCLSLTLILICGSVSLIGPAFVSAQTAPARKIRLFEGFTVKILSGKLVIYGEPSESGESPLPSLTFLQCAHDTTSASTWTFASQNVGTSSATRATIIGVFTRDSIADHNVTSVSVGGDSATEVVDEAGSGAPNSAIYILSNPSGTTENVVASSSEPETAATICLWAAYDLISTTAVASTADNGSLSVSLDLSTTSADGIAVGMCGADSSMPLTATWTGLAENNAEIGTDGRSSSASIVPTDGGALPITCAWSGAPGVTGVSAAFR